MMTYWQFKRHGSRYLYSLHFNYIFSPSPAAVGFTVYTGANQAFKLERYAIKLRINI